MSLIAGICVCLTGHERFGVREVASAWLSRHADHSPGAVQAGRRSECHEVRQRCEWAFRKWVPGHLDAATEWYKPAGWTYFPWVWTGQRLPAMSAMPDAGLLAMAYLRIATSATGRSEIRYATYSEATRLWVKDLLARGEFRQAEFLIEVLAEAHRAYCERNGLPVPP